MVGDVGFEPTAFPPQTEHSDQTELIPVIGTGARIRTAPFGFGDQRAAANTTPIKLFYEYTPSLSDLLLSAIHIAECIHKKAPNNKNC